MKLACVSLVPVLALLARGAPAQCQVEKLVPPETEYGDNFGWSVALSGDWAMVGAYGDDDVAVLSGAVYVYQRQGGAWVQTQKLKASDAEPNTVFGYRVAIDGDHAVATSPSARSRGIQLTGAAYVFELVGSSWLEVARLTATDATADAQLGHSAAISGERVLVGTDQEDHAGSQSGAAYLFEKVGGSWVQVQKLVASDGQIGQHFGNDVDIEGNRCVVGAAGVSTGPLSNYGAAYVFEKQGSVWVEQAKLVASDAASFDTFGWSVACSGPTVFAGAPGQNTFGSNAGAVYAFELIAGQWVERQKLGAWDAQPGDGFGRDLAVSGPMLVVSSPSDDDLASSSGSVHTFELAAGAWVQTGKTLAADSVLADAFGARLALSGRDLLVGVPLDDEACPSDPVCNSGSAYALALPTGTTQYGSCTSSSPCSNADDFGGCRNSTGQGAVLSACGSSSVALDDLVLHGQFLPPSVFGIVFMGASETQVPLGDGLRVAAPAGDAGLYRFPAAQVSAQGTFTLGPGIVSMSQAFPGLGAIQPGHSRRFQLWYRDGQGPCGNGTNASSGVRVDFAP